MQTCTKCLVKIQRIQSATSEPNYESYEKTEILQLFGPLLQTTDFFLPQTTTLRRAPVLNRGSVCRQGALGEREIARKRGKARERHCETMTMLSKAMKLDMTVAMAFGFSDGVCEKLHLPHESYIVRWSAFAWVVNYLGS